jgi:hypothetical protein
LRLFYDGCWQRLREDNMAMVKNDGAMHPDAMAGAPMKK